MHITLITPTLNRIEDCKKMIQSARDGTVKPNSVLVIDNSVGLFKLEETDIDQDIPTLVLTPERNLGVAQSWNLGIDFARKYFSANVVIVANDDILFYPDTIEIMLEYAKEHNADIVYPGGVNKEGNIMNAFSLFLTTPEFILDDMNGFDIGFIRAYFEDNDLKRRMDLEGYTLEAAPCSYDHIGSATLHTLNYDQQMEHHSTFRYNQARYLAKWGGKPHFEIFTHPFNGELDSKEWHKRIKETQ